MVIHAQDEFNETLAEITQLTYREKPMQFIAVLKLIITLLPLLIETIKLIEDAIPGQGKGEAKLSAVRGVVESSYKVSNETLPVFESVWPAIQKVTSSIVDSFNNSGVFKK